MCRVLQLMNWGFCRLPTLVEPVGFDLFSSSLNCLILVLQLFERVSHTQTHEPQNPGLFVEWQSCSSAKDAVQHQASVGVAEPSAGPWGKTSGGKLGKETGAILAACLRNARAMPARKGLDSPAESKVESWCGPHTKQRAGELRHKSSSGIGLVAIRGEDTRPFSHPLRSKLGGDKLDP